MEMGNGTGMDKDKHLLGIAILVQARPARLRQRLARLHHDGAAQTGAPAGGAVLRHDLDAVGDERDRFGAGVLQLRGGDAAGVREVVVGEVDDGRLGGVAAAEDGGAAAEVLREEGGDGGDVGHAREVVVEGLDVAAGEGAWLACA